MVKMWFRYLGSLWILTVWLCLLVAPTATAQSAAVGDVVRNIASFSFEINGAEHSDETNAAEFTVQDAPAAPTIEFFRHAPTAPEPINRPVNGSDFSPSGSNDGPFSPTPAPRAADGSEIDLDEDIPLFPAATYTGGETIFVRVTDPRGNRDPNAIDTVVITVQSDTGDIITLRLYETGPNTGEFWGHFPSIDGDSPQFNEDLSTEANDQLVARYDNGFLQGEVIADTAFIDPFGRVFDSTTGDLINEAVVRLVNANDLSPASVWGVDGFSSYPSEVISGEAASDTSGLVYPFGEGEFRFPIAETGRYFVEVIPPEGYTFASSRLPSHFETIGNFIVIDASFGQTFAVEGFEGIRFDIPLDPEAELVLTKTAGVTTADVGDFIPYTVSISNIGITPTPVDLMDTLPLGFRYVPGSAFRDGVATDDPIISDTATFLTFGLGQLEIGETVTLDYTLEVGPGAPLGDAINEAVVIDTSGNQISNIGRAEITLREDLFRTRSTIIGRISEQSCDSDEEWARDINKGIGVEGVRVYIF